MDLRIFPPDGILEASVDLPYSKSISARALIINKIGSFSEPERLSDSDDTKVLRAGLAATGGTVDVGAAGTAMRFLTAYFASAEGVDVVLDGSERMRKRPIGILVEALRCLGADIEYVDNEGFPPLRIRGKKLSGGEVSLNASVSSQFVSALMMIAPRLTSALSIVFDNEPVSLPYIKMTASMMTEAGVEPDVLYRRVEIPHVPYSAPITTVERDWSAASYWYSIVALSAGWVTFNDMSIDSIQGDGVMKALGEKIGVLTSESEDVDRALELSASPEQHSRLDLDMSDTPDIVQTLAVAASALGIPFRFTGVHTLRDKETDRLEALKNEALKLGLLYEIEGDDVISWEGGRVPITQMPEIATYSDHRMAMAFAPLAIFLPGIVIRDSEVVAKSYPDFWTHLEEAGFTLRDAAEPIEEIANDTEE